jgi:hypothetical protein
MSQGPAPVVIGGDELLPGSNGKFRERLIQFIHVIARLDLLGRILEARLVSRSDLVSVSTAAESFAASKHQAEFENGGKELILPQSLPEPPLPH